MDLAPALRAASGNLADARRIRAIPPQLSRKIPLTPLAEQLVLALDVCVAGALRTDSPDAFNDYLATHIADFVANAVALGAQHPPSSELPRTCSADWLVELLGNGADLELEFCESTLWSCLGRASMLDQALPTMPEVAARALSARFIGHFFVGIFCWAVVQRSATVDRPHPAAVGAALRGLRESALNAVVALDEAAQHAPATDSEPLPTVFDAEDWLLARSP